MKTNLLTTVLTHPEHVNTLDNAQWNELLRLAKASSMLVRFYHKIEQAGFSQAIPEKIQRHIDSELVLLNFQKTQVAYEIKVVAMALNRIGIIPTLLKGAAYQMAQLSLANNRLFSDIDMLLSQEEIAKAEKILKCDGWISQKADDYDQEYYRRYMHEIPPIQHYQRGTVLDLHHNLLPTCNKKKLNISDFTRQSCVIESPVYQCKVLAPSAMYLHSAIHLFHEGEFEKGLRGISDLDLLYREFSAVNECFCKEVISLAEKNHQQQSLYFAWYYSHTLLNCPLSATAKGYVDNYRKSLILPKFYDFIFNSLLIPHHNSLFSVKFHGAALLAYLRGHLLRMPLKLLVPHLMTKTWRAITALLSKQPDDSARIK